MRRDKIKFVRFNNRTRCVEISVAKGRYHLPYAKLDPQPTPEDKIVHIFVDPDLDGRAVTYKLESGLENSVHLDAFLDYHRDPEFMQNLLKYKLTSHALALIKSAGTTRAELERRLKTSPSQITRLLDPKNYSKSIDSMIKLLSVLGAKFKFAILMPAGRNGRSKTGKGSSRYFELDLKTG